MDAGLANLARPSGVFRKKQLGDSDLEQYSVALVCNLFLLMNGYCNELACT